MSSTATRYKRMQLRCDMKIEPRRSRFCKRVILAIEGTSAAPPSFPKRLAALTRHGRYFAACVSWHSPPRASSRSDVKCVKKGARTLMPGGPISFPAASVTNFRLPTFAQVTNGGTIQSANSVVACISGVAAAHNRGEARSTRAEIPSSAPMPPRLHCQ